MDDSPEQLRPPDRISGELSGSSLHIYFVFYPADFFSPSLAGRCRSHMRVGVSPLSL